ncbi:ATP-dependent zinc metalloprotease FtsH [bioreactor metagenome]|uniref:ATP-dependent zinc metalloprotease FtsH n=1 Tax=bioreactor metagenome TaxID=1076179 RepID=A0A644YCS2_9ZZZZ
MQSVDSKLLLKNIDIIFRESRMIIAEDLPFNSVEKSLSTISNYFSINNRESFIFAILFVLNLSETKISFLNLTEHFSSQPTNILLFKTELESLCTKGILRKNFSGGDEDLFGVRYMVNRKVVADILDNKPFCKETLKERDLYSLLEKIFKTIDNRESIFGGSNLLSAAVLDIMNENLDIPFINAILDMKLKDENNLIFLYVIWAILDENLEPDAGIVLYSIYSKASERVRVMQRLIDGSHELLKKGLLETGEGLFSSDIHLKLSEATINLAKSYGVIFNKKSKSSRKIITPSQIRFKQLIFNDKAISQLNTLKDLLSHNRYENLTKSFEAMNLPECVTAIFYGSPGTGKTESVMQIARETNREILKVDISQTKSMWYGESEKIVKQIFKDYKNFMNESVRTPILLINEADALISKRLDISFSSTKQTENTIQNIILEELENFKGILIATTNLLQNFDKAFDRRFLYKIHFPKPNQEIRIKIWKNKKPDLSISDCNMLASKFPFSGGHIDNIIRKISIEEAIQDLPLPIDKIVEICSTELLQKNGDLKTIGF